MTAYELDHLAIAVPEWSAAGSMLASDLGGRFKHGFRLRDFSPCQISFADDMRLELLAPGAAEGSFLVKFLGEDDGAARPHHVTFKVHDIHQAIARAREHGIEPILVRTDNELWREAFLHPRDTGLGFLVQMVQACGDPADFTGDDAEWRVEQTWQEPSSGASSGIAYLLGSVASWENARRALADILGAEREVLEAGRGETWERFRWPEGADLVLTDSPAAGTQPGITAAGVTPPGAPARGDYSPDSVYETVAAAAVAPALGIKLADAGPGPA